MQDEEEDYMPSYWGWGGRMVEVGDEVEEDGFVMMTMTTWNGD